VDASFDPCPACAQGDPAPGTPEHAADYLLGRHAGYGLSEITYWKGVLAAYARRCTEALRTERDDLRARLDEARTAHDAQTAQHVRDVDAANERAEALQAVLDVEPGRLREAWQAGRWSNRDDPPADAVARIIAERDA